MYKNMLLAVDGSDHSLRAAKESAKIASLCHECKIELVYVADFTKTKNEVLHSKDKRELELERRKKLLPIEELLTSSRLTYDVTILHGEPGPAIVEYANKEDRFDIVIIGSRGLNSLQEMVLGSVSHKVVKRVDCPVLIVK